MRLKIFLVCLITITLLVIPATSMKITTTNPNLSVVTQQNNENSQIIDIVKDEKQNNGILPAFVFVTCNWKTVDAGEGERTIHFWVFGYGSHELKWKTWNDHDGDGNWDLWGPEPPWREEWFSFLLPIRHFKNWVGWDGYPGQAKVKVEYWLDGDYSTKTFTEPR